MNRQEITEIKKYLQKVRKLFNQISKDSNNYVDEFDTISYSLNKIDNILNKASSNTTRSKSKDINQRKDYNLHITSKSDDSVDSDEESQKVKMIIENCRVTTETLSRKIKVLCNLPNTGNKSKQYKQYLNQKETLKHSESANVKDFKVKFKSLNHRQRQYDDQQEHGKKIKNLDSDIRKLTKELAYQINGKN